MTKQSAPEKDHRKPCTLCQQPRNVLVRCQIDSSGAWNFVCPGKCWRRVSGGVVDGALKGAGVGNEGAENSGGDEDEDWNGDGDRDDDSDDAVEKTGDIGELGKVMGSQWYRYGGMWKNKHEGASAKMPRRVKEKMKEKGRAGKTEPTDADVKEADRDDITAQDERLQA